MFRLVSNFIYNVYDKIRIWWRGEKEKPIIFTHKLRKIKVRDWDGREAKRFNYKRRAQRY